jgi:mevalonate kinase
MIAGEHAVVYQGGAIACALDIHMHFFWTDNSHSQTLRLICQAGYLDYSLSNKTFSSESLESSFWQLSKILIKTLDLQGMLSGGTLYIKSDFSDLHGLGSSAAFCLGVIRSLGCKTLFNSQRKLLLFALSSYRRLSPMASGTDIAASLYGGVIYFEPRSVKVTLLPSFFSSCLLAYCGYKTPTTSVIKFVKRRLVNDPKNFILLDRISAVTLHLAQSILNHKPYELLDLYFIEHQQFLAQLGLMTSELSSIVENLRTDTELWGVKISGSGLGDSIIAFGNSKKKQTFSFPHPQSSIQSYQLLERKYEKVEYLDD